MWSLVSECPEGILGVCTNERGFQRIHCCDVQGRDLWTLGLFLHEELNHSIHLHEDYVSLASRVRVRVFKRDSEEVDGLWLTEEGSFQKSCIVANRLLAIDKDGELNTFHFPAKEFWCWDSEERFVGVSSVGTDCIALVGADNKFSVTIHPVLIDPERGLGIDSDTQLCRNVDAIQGTASGLVTRKGRKLHFWNEAGQKIRIIKTKTVPSCLAWQGDFAFVGGDKGCQGWNLVTGKDKVSPTKTSVNCLVTTAEYLYISAHSGDNSWFVRCPLSNLKEVQTLGCSHESKGYQIVPLPFSVVVRSIATGKLQIYT